MILAGSAAPSALQHPNASLGGLIVAILIMGLGGGAVRTNVSPLMAEQYTGKIRKQVLKSGETVIISPALTYQRIYLYFYASINLGSTAAISASFIARDHGYWVAFLIPTITFAIVPLVIVFGNKYYVKTPPRGSIILEVCFIFTFQPFIFSCSHLSPTVYPCLHDRRCPQDIYQPHYHLEKLQEARFLESR